MKHTNANITVKEIELYAMGLSYKEVGEVIKKEDNIDVSKQAIQYACSKFAKIIGINLEEYRFNTIRKRAMNIALEKEMKRIPGTSMALTESIVWLRVHSSSYKEIVDELKLDMCESSVYSRVEWYCNKYNINIYELNEICLRHRAENIIAGKEISQNVKNERLKIVESIMMLRKQGLRFNDITKIINEQTNESYTRSKLYTMYRRYLSKIGLTDKKDVIQLSEREIMNE